MAGFPGTRSSMWQQAGRAGRAGQEALAVLVARDDPLDTYLTHHPEALFGRPVEATVLDPDNPYVLAPHLCAAAAELPLTDDDLAAFGPHAAEVAAGLVERGLLRRRATGLFWTRPERASDLADIRGRRRPAGRPGRGGDRTAARHRRRRGRPRDRPRRRGLRAPGRDLPGVLARPRRPGGADEPRRPGLDDDRPRRHRHRRGRDHGQPRSGSTSRSRSGRSR